MQPSLKLSRENLNNIIALYGADVLKSKAFNEGFKQKHHGKTTVSDHSFRVAMACAGFGIALHKIGVKYDLKTAVRMSLSHDLGILGRYDGKFHGVKHCCAPQHPLDSAQVADEILPDMTEKELNGIRMTAILLSLLLFIAAFILLITMIIPEIITSVSRLSREIPLLLNQSSQ